MVAQSELIEFIRLEFLNIFLKNIIKTNPIENSTLAIDISSSDRTYIWISSK